MTIVENIPENEIQDAELVTEEEKAQKAEEEQKAAKPGGLLLVHAVKSDGSPIEGGIQFTLDKDLKLTPEQALSFIKAFSASKLPDGRTMVITAHLANGITKSEVYTFSSLEEYDEDAAIEFGKNKLLHDVWQMLQFLWSVALFTPNKEKENDDMAAKLAEAIGKKEKELETNQV